MAEIKTSIYTAEFSLFDKRVHLLAIEEMAGLSESELRERFRYVITWKFKTPYGLISPKNMKKSNRRVLANMEVLDAKCKWAWIKYQSL